MGIETLLKREVIKCCYEFLHTFLKSHHGWTNLQHSIRELMEYGTHKKKHRFWCHQTEMWLGDFRWLCRLYVKGFLIPQYTPTAPFIFPFLSSSHQVAPPLADDGTRTAQKACDLKSDCCGDESSIFSRYFKSRPTKWLQICIRKTRLIAETKHRVAVRVCILAWTIFCQNHQ